MEESLAETQFQKEVKTMTWEQLKLRLKELTISEDYEMCAMIQHEIDERVKHIEP